MSIRCFLLTWAALLAAAEMALSDDFAPRFHLCPAFVESARVADAAKPTRSAVVQILLSDAGREALETFTTAHLGELIELVAGTTVIVEATVRTIIDSGVAASRPLPPPAAAKLHHAIGAAPEAPCGEPAV